jgi:hypothetical protein
MGEKVAPGRRTYTPPAFHEHLDELLRLEGVEESVHAAAKSDLLRCLHEAYSEWLNRPEPIPAPGLRKLLAEIQKGAGNLTKLKRTYDGMIGHPPHKHGAGVVSVQTWPSPYSPDAAELTEKLHALLVPAKGEPAPVPPDPEGLYVHPSQGWWDRQMIRRPALELWCVVDIESLLQQWHDNLNRRLRGRGRGKQNAKRAVTEIAKEHFYRYSRHRTLVRSQKRSSNFAEEFYKRVTGEASAKSPYERRGAPPKKRRQALRGRIAK